MNPKKNIIYLYSEVMPYVIAVMRSLVDNFNVDVHCIYWDEKKKTPFLPQNEKGITFYRRSEYNKDTLTAFIEEKAPAIIYVSGRMDKLYLEMALLFRKKGVKLVTGSDNQWSGSRKQLMQAAFSNILYRKYFEYIWIPGNRQYEFARKIGYPGTRIIRNLYCADSSVFMKAHENNKAEKQAHYPHSIVFVGRFTGVKGIDVLTTAFALAKKDVKNDWKLILVGAGDLKFEQSDDIEIIEFIPNSELAERSKDWGVFCLPSIKEPWGVVVHEFAAAGLPLICSEAVGAADTFIINGYNGYTFNTGDAADLKKKLVTMMAASDEEIFAMGTRSNAIASVIDPVKSAYSLMSILA